MESDFKKKWIHRRKKLQIQSAPNVSLLFSPHYLILFQKLLKLATTTGVVILYG
jgi:hypothetical protein